MQVTGLGRTEHGLVECRRMVVARPGQGTGWEGIEYTAMHSARLVISLSPKKTLFGI